MTTISLQNINIGDYIQGTTYTYSQKYIMSEGYEEYNTIKKGIVVQCSKISCEHVLIKKDDGEVVSVCLDPGSSGGWWIERL
uniref:Uncharacterized protein n=1 Tax=viral metagenome TaxID=1070528 RepID=A0A6C0J4X3_9ZZZZ